MKKLILSLFWFLFSVTIFSQNHWNGKQLVLQNEAISRIIVLENGEFSTMSYRLKDYPFNFVRIQEDEPTFQDKNSCNAGRLRMVSWDQAGRVFIFAE